MSEVPKEIDEDGLREQQQEKIIDFLTRIGAYEYTQKLLSHSEAKDEFSFEKFKDFLVRINGIARDIPIHQRKDDGEKVQLEGFGGISAVPKHEDKAALLKETYEALSRISPEDRAYLLPVMVNEVHLFNDGNGRTSRILHTLLKKFDSKEAFEVALALAVGKHGRSESPDLDPSLTSADREKILLTRHGLRFRDDTSFSPMLPEGFAGTIAVEESTTPKAQAFMRFRREDLGGHCFLAAYEYLKEKDKLSETTMLYDKGMLLSPLKMEQVLSDADWDAMTEKYNALKRERAQILIDAFVEPDKYKNLEGTMNLKDYFKDEVQKRWKRNQA